MFRLFNQKSKVRATMQAVNLLAATAAAIQIVTDPEATLGEFGLDMATHLISYFALSENASLLPAAGSVLANTARLGAILQAVTSGCTVAPLVAEGIDALTHLSNMIVPVATMEEPEQTSARPTMQ